jgi:hypothetical protein
MILHKNTENYQQQHGCLSLFHTFMEYEARLIQYFYRIGFHESRVKTHEKSLCYLNLHKI